MRKLNILGRIFYGVAFAGIGMLHILYEGFRPLILPIAAEETRSISALIWLLGAYFALSGIIIATGKKARSAALLLGAVLLTFVIFGHIPNRLVNHPEIINYWTDSIKLFALSGGAFTIAQACPKQMPDTSVGVRWVMTAGKYFYAAMLCIFGLVHIFQADLVGRIVPPYVPLKTFFTYASGFALVSCGLSLIFRYKVKITALFLACMLMAWLLMLHLYYAILYPDSESFMGIMVCLAFCGIALTLAKSTASSQTPSV